MNRAEMEEARTEAIERRAQLRRALLSFDDREARGERLAPRDRNARRQIQELNRIIASLTTLIGD